jgi:NADPH:quinone reductase-like Zn-dependent oxidoreductase
MKAMVCTKYGSPDVIEIHEVEKPTPKDNEVLIKIITTTISSGDARMRGADFPLLFWLPMRLMIGFSGPRKKIQGFSLAGEIEAVGKDVTKFKKGDQVLGITGFDFGAHGQYICLGESADLIIKPAEMSFEEAVSIPFSGTTAMHFLKKADIQPGQKILIYGASGAVGTAAVQLAKHHGAEVTGVCSGANLELVKSQGADFVIDYTKEDFSQNGEVYDVIFDTVGKSPYSGSLNSLKKDGFYLRAVNLTLPSILRGIWVSMTSSKKVIGGMADEKAKDLQFLVDLYQAGNYKPVVDKCYPLEQAVAAHVYVDTGHKKGTVVINMAAKN